MISDSQPLRRPSPDMPSQVLTARSYMDWNVILAGGVLALAIAFLLIGFGTSLGLSLTSPYRGEGVSAAWLAIAAGIWFAWVMVSGFGAGGYLAGRMRSHAGDATPDEVTLRDGVHGLMVWATAALTSIVIAASGVGGALGIGASAVGSATEIAAEAAPTDYFASVLLRNGVQPRESSETTPEPAPMADGDAPALPSRQQGVAPGQASQIAAPETRQEIATILARSVSEGALADRDRSHLANLVAANSDLGPDAALARVDEVQADIAAARDTALDGVEQARIAGVVFGFIAAATLLIGAVAAFFAAIAGGHHRDTGLGLDVLTSRH